MTSNLQESQRDFEEFLRKNNSLSEARKLPYELTDIVYHEWHYGVRNSKLKRFYFGGTLWIARWIFLCMKSALFPSRVPKGLFDEKSKRIDVLSFYLSTPAHADTLNAINNSLREDLAVSNICKTSDNIQNPYDCKAIFLPEFSDSIGINFLCLKRALINLIKARRALKVSGFNVSRNDYWAVLLELLFRYEVAVEFWRKYLPPVSVILLTYELPTEHKALTKVAAERGIRVIHIMHGQRLPTYQITLASDVVLFSGVDRPWFEKRIPKNVKIWTIGHPRLEFTNLTVGKPYKAISRKPRIAFFSQGVDQDYPRSQYIHDLLLLRALEGRCELRIRPHPRESTESLLEYLGETNIKADISSEGLIADLKWCDAVASSWSTISMEAAACGRGVFWTCTDPECYPAAKELREHGIGALISKPEDWDSYLHQWETGEWEEPVIVRDARLKELGMIGEMHKSWAERLSISKSENS